MGDASSNPELFPWVVSQKPDGADADEEPPAPPSPLPMMGGYRPPQAPRRGATVARTAASEALASELAALMAGWGQAPEVLLEAIAQAPAEARQGLPAHAGLWAELLDEVGARRLMACWGER